MGLSLGRKRARLLLLGADISRSILAEHGRFVIYWNCFRELCYETKTMKKKILITLLILALLFAGLLTWAALAINTLIAQFKPQIETMASSAVGARVNVGNLETQIFPTTRIKIDQVKITEKDASGESFSLNNVLLELRLLPLLSKKLVISKLIIERPALTAIKDSQGIRIAGLPRRPAGATGDNAKPAAVTNANGSAAPVAVDLKNFELREATVTILDRQSGRQHVLSELNVESALDVAGTMVKIPQIEVHAKLDEIPVELHGSDILFDTAAGRLTVKGILTETLGNRLTADAVFHTKDGSGSLTLRDTKIDLKSLAGLGKLVPPIVAQLDLHGSAVPTAQLDLHGSRMNAKGTIDLQGVGLRPAANFTVSDGSGTVSYQAALPPLSADVETAALGFKLNGAALEASLQGHFEPQRLTLKALDVKGLGGTTHAEGAVDIAERISFSQSFALREIALDQALGILSPALAAKLAGTLARVDGTISGALGPQLMSSLAGAVSLLLENGALKGVNIAGQVLKSVKGIPLVSGALYSIVPPDKRPLLDAADTEFRSVSGNFKIGNGALTTSDLHVVGPMFTLFGRGAARFDGSVDLNATISFDPEFSRSLVGAVKELDKLLDPTGRLTIPLTISGTAPGLLIVPDVRKLVELGAKNLAKEKAGQLIDRALGNKLGGSGKAIGDLLGF